VPRPCNFSRFCLLNNIWWAVQIMCSLTYSPVTSSLVGPNIFLSTLFLNNLSLRFFLNIGAKQSFTPIQKYRQNLISVYLVLYISG
jgi:hypothetical protein